MFALNHLFAILASTSAVPADDPGPGNSAAALAVIAVVLGAAIVTETVRHRRRRRVHHPVPLARRRPNVHIDIDRSTRDLPRSTELVAHRP